MRICVYASMRMRVCVRIDSCAYEYAYKCVWADVFLAYFNVDSCVISKGLNVPS